MDNYEKLQQFKQLLDEGIITQDEFEVRKNQILFPEKIEEEKRRIEEEEQKLAEEKRKNEAFDNAVLKFEDKTIESYKQAFSELEKLGDWRDADKIIEQHRNELAEMEKVEADRKAEAEKQELYERAVKKFNVPTSASFRSAIADLEKIGDWKDAKEILETRKPELKTIEETENKNKETKKKKWFIAGGVAAVLVLFAIIFFSYIQPNVIVPMQRYNEAVDLLDNGKPVEAEKIFKELGEYKDSKQQIENCEVAKADLKLERKQYGDALLIYKQYKDNPNVTADKIEKCEKGLFDDAVSKYDNGSYETAKEIFEKISDYPQSKDYIDKCNKGMEKRKEEIEKARKENVEKFEEVSESVEEEVMDSKYANNEMLENIYVDADWSESDGAGYVTIGCNMESSSYNYLLTQQTGTDAAIAYEMILLDMSNYCYSIKQEYEDEGVDNVHVFFYVWPPGKGKGQTCFSYVSDEKIESNPYVN